jgi:two-component system response regulator BaeR
MISDTLNPSLRISDIPRAWLSSLGQTVVDAYLEGGKHRPAQAIQQIVHKNLSLNFEKFACECSGIQVELTEVQFRILFAMTKRPGCVFTRNQLMSEAYQDGRIVSDRTIDTHVKNIRKKLSFKNQNPELTQEIIHSVYGLGYKVQ